MHARPSGIYLCREQAQRLASTSDEIAGARKGGQKEMTKPKSRKARKREPRRKQIRSRNPGTLLQSMITAATQGMASSLGAVLITSLLFTAPSTAGHNQKSEPICPVGTGAQ